MVIPLLPFTFLHAFYFLASALLGEGLEPSKFYAITWGEVWNGEIFGNRSELVKKQGMKLRFPKV